MPETVCRLSLIIPEDLYDLYEQEAEEKEKTLNEVIIERLYACRHHHSSRGLYFDDSERSELESLTGGRILNTPQDAIKRIRNMESIRLGNVQVVVPPAVLTRLKSRCSRNMDFPEFVKTQAIHGLEQFVMLR